MLSGRTAWQSQGFLEMLTAWPWLIHESLNAIGWHFFQLVAQPLSEVVQDAQLRCFIVQQCVERRFGLARVRLDHLQLLDNAALKFDATFNVLVFPLDVGNRFARLITHALKRGAPLRPRLGVNRALCDAVGSKKAAIGPAQSRACYELRR